MTKRYWKAYWDFFIEPILIGFSILFPISIILFWERFVSGYPVWYLVFIPIMWVIGILTTVYITE